MQPDSIRVEPWVWLPVAASNKRILPAVMLAASVIAGGYLVGCNEVKPEMRTPPSPETAAQNTPVPAQDASGKRPSLALEGAAEAPSPAAEPAPQERAPVKLLNPGTAQKQTAAHRPPRARTLMVGGTSPAHAQPRCTGPSRQGKNRRGAI